MHNCNSHLFFRKKAAVDIQRIGEMANILAKNGLLYFVDRLRLTNKLTIGSQFRKYESIEEIEASLPSRAKTILEELGPTYVKLGQVLSTRPDLVGDEVTAELSKLQDNVAPFESAIAKKIVKEELGKPVEVVFKEFSARPLASASLAQVHKAVLKSGEEVVVKIKRPCVDVVTAQDIALLKYFVKLTEKQFPEWKIYNFSGLVDEFERVIARELDFTLEVKNIKRFRNNFRNSETIYAPLVYEEYCTKNIIVMELIDGKKISELVNEKTPSKKFNKALIAERGADAFFKQILDNGFFHADPHPGNLMVLPHNKLCFLDFGMMGKISEENISLLTDLFLAIIMSDSKVIISQLEKMNLFRPEVDIREFEEDINDLVDKYYGLDLKEIDIGEASKELFGILGKYHIKIPRDYMLLIRALALVEGVGKKLDPNFNATQFFEPYAKRVAKKKLSPVAVTKTMFREVVDIQNTLRELPQNMKKIFDFIQQGKISIDFEHKNLDIFARNMEHITNKLTMAIITAALIIGSALIMETNKGPTWLDFPIIGIAGFILSIFLCLLITYSIWRYKI